MGRQFGIYLHVPFCATRCGYCDFNTYTAQDLGGGGSRAEYPSLVAAELRLAAASVRRPVETVFVGGGTPTLLTPAELGGFVTVIREEFGLVDGAEVTTEANPESVGPSELADLRAAGFTRISFGMQSAREHVLRVLDRQHTPGRAVQCVRWAQEAGFEHVNLDLIYGAPGETHDDWARTLDAAVGAGPDHVSAYSLILEEGTRITARVRRGELAATEDDVLADRYLMAEETLTAAGLDWYEVSNWARTSDSRSAHNVLYWTDGDWWGIGPGAHSHLDGRRWWNVKHPRDYAARLATGSPEADHEDLTQRQRDLETVMLRLRLRDGLPLDALSARGRVAAGQASLDGLLDREAVAEGRAVLTLRGRLLADAVIRDLTD